MCDYLPVVVEVAQLVVGKKRCKIALLQSRWKEPEENRYRLSPYSYVLAELTDSELLRRPVDIRAALHLRYSHMEWR